MSNEISQVESISMPDGLNNLVKGYMEYATETIRDRAIPNIDGLKPSQRRILVTMKELEKVKGWTKCQSICGTCMKLHPHGDGAIYATLCRLTDVSEMMNIPLIKGKGKFQKVYSEDPSAAARYTECEFTPIMEEYFNDADGVNRIPNFDNSRDEPEVLGVSFPSILCNPTEGIAIGLASNIPAFNFHDVVKATINVIKTGRMGELIAPDFTTCGEYVYNETELKKIAKRGKGSIKLRGKWRIEGKTIIIDEIPYYTTIQKIKRDAEKINGVVRCKDLTGLRDGRTVMRLDVECSNKNVVDYVLNTMLKETDLQMQVSANIVVIIDGEPRALGIEELLREWVKFRTHVLHKKYSLALASYKFEIARYEVLVKLLTDKELRDNFISALTKGEIMARGVLNSAFPDVDPKTLDWILDMKIRSFASSDKAITKLNNFKAALAETENNLKDIPGVIVKQLEALNAKYSYPRRTEITNTDYTFEAVKPAPYKVIVEIKDKFISKTTYTPAIARIMKGIECMSDDVISIIDTKGRLLRVNLEAIPQTSTGAKGIYIPSFCEVPDDFDIVDYDLIENATYGYVYADGFASFLDLSEWVGVQRKTKCTPNGMPAFTHLIRGKFSPDAQVLYVITNKNRFGFIRNDFKQKSRTARTRIINVGEGEEITGIKAMSLADALLVCPNMISDYMGKLKKLTEDMDFNVEYFNSL